MYHQLWRCSKSAITGGKLGNCQRWSMQIRYGVIIYHIPSQNWSSIQFVLLISRLHAKSVWETYRNDTKLVNTRFPNYYVHSAHSNTLGWANKKKLVYFLGHVDSIPMVRNNLSKKLLKENRKKHILELQNMQNTSMFAVLYMSLRSGWALLLITRVHTRPPHHTTGGETCRGARTLTESM